MFQARTVLLTLALLVIGLPSARGQGFDSGSDGSDGAFNPAENTEIDLSLAATASWDTPSPGAVKPPAPAARP